MYKTYAHPLVEILAALREKEVKETVHPYEIGNDL